MADDLRSRPVFYAEELMPLLSPGRRPAEATIARDIAILTRHDLRGEPLGDVLLAVREARKQANYGKLGTWIRPGEAFTLRALTYQGEGMVNYYRFLHEARKREAKAPTSKPFGKILAEMTQRGLVG